MRNKILLLHRPFDKLQTTPAAYFVPYMLKSGTIPYSQYRSLNIVQRLINKICRKHLCVSFNKWKLYIKKYSVIIIYIQNNNDILEFIHKIKSPEQRVIVWYWNPVFHCVHPDKIRNLGFELWAFDPADCLQYNIKFNTTYYFKDLKLPPSNFNHQNIFFCGLNKGRKDTLDLIQKKITLAGLTFYFYIVDDELPINKRLPHLTYQKYLEYLSVSDAILDVLQEGQDGMTLRVMEALFHKKKLITTQKAIKKADFYHPDNVFIIGEDEWAGIRDFLVRPLHSISKEIIEKYDFSMWIRRFGIELEK